VLCEARAPEPPEAAPAWLLPGVFLIGFAAGSALTVRLCRGGRGAAVAAEAPPPAAAQAPAPLPAPEAALAIAAGPAAGPVTPLTRHGGGQVPGHR